MAPAPPTPRSGRPSQEYPSLAKGQFILSRELSGCRYMTLSKQDKHLYGSNFRHPMHEVVLARGSFGLRQHGRRAGHITPDQFEAGQEHLTQNEPVNELDILPRQLQALFSVLFSGLQVVPLVVDPSQSKIHDTGIRRPVIINQLQDTPVGPSRQVKLVLQLLHPAQAGGSQYGVDYMPRRLGDR